MGQHSTAQNRTRQDSTAQCQYLSLELIELVHLLFPHCHKLLVAPLDGGDHALQGVFCHRMGDREQLHLNLFQYELFLSLI